MMGPSTELLYGSNGALISISIFPTWTILAEKTSCALTVALRARSKAVAARLRSKILPLLICLIVIAVTPLRYECAVGFQLPMSKSCRVRPFCERSSHHNDRRLVLSVNVYGAAYHLFTFAIEDSPGQARSLLCRAYSHNLGLFIVDHVLVEFAVLDVEGNFGIVSELTNLIMEGLFKCVFLLGLCQC